MRTSSLFLCLAALVLCGCRTTTRSREFSATEAAYGTHLAPDRAWAVRVGADVTGSVVAFRSADGRTYYSVRDPYHHELGLVDSLGRAWRYRPHQEEAEWIATGSLAVCAAAILGTSEECRLEEIEPEVLASGPAQR